MAMYIELKVGEELIGAFGVQRQEDLSDKDKSYPYVANRYIPTASGVFRKAEKPENIRIINHVYSDGAEALAYKVLKAFHVGK